MTQFVVTVIVIGVAIVVVVAWGLLGPRRKGDAAGHHVDLQRETERRDRERAGARQGDDDGAGGDGTAR